MNLYDETTDAIVQHGKTWSSVRWIGTVDGAIYIPKSKWKKALNVDYDPGFGGAEIPEILVVVGEDWWLERAEYDGSEWWEYKTLPKLAFKSVIIDSVENL